MKLTDEDLRAWRDPDNTRFRLESNVITCLLQDFVRVRGLCEEFCIEPKDFSYAALGLIYDYLMTLGGEGGLTFKDRNPAEDDTGLWGLVYSLHDALPTAANARYYVEEFHDLSKK